MLFFLVGLIIFFLVWIMFFIINSILLGYIEKKTDGALGCGETDVAVIFIFGPITTLLIFYALLEDLKDSFCFFIGNKFSKTFQKLFNIGRGVE